MSSGSSRRYDLCLGAISLPVLWAVWISDGTVKLSELSDGARGFGALAFTVGLSLLGSAGMALGGIVGSYVTRTIGSRGLRVMALTAIVPGIAFFIASVPFLLLYIYGAVFAWWLSVTKWGAYAYVVTLLWSLVRVRRGTPGEGSESTKPDDGMALMFAVLLGLWGFFTLYIAVRAKINLATF